MFGWARVPQRVGNTGVSALRALRFGRDDACCGGAKGVSLCRIDQNESASVCLLTADTNGVHILEGQPGISFVLSVITISLAVSPFCSQVRVRTVLEKQGDLIGLPVHGRQM